MFEKKKYLIFTIVTIIWGCIMSFMIPMWQIPDERMHVTMIGYSLGNADLANYLYDDVNYDQARISFHYEEKVDTKLWVESMTKKPSYSFSDVAPSGMNISIVKRLPATVGLMLGLLLRLPTFWAMQLGEFFSLVAYALLATLALRIMPIKKELFAIMMLLPMAIQEAGSFSVDALLMPLIYLLIALIFYLRYVVEKVKIKDMIIIMALWGLITYCKVPYIFLIMLVFMIPFEKIELYFLFGKKKGEALSVMQVRIFGITVFLFCAIIGGVGVYIFRHNVFVQVVYGMITEWRQSINLLRSSYYAVGPEIKVGMIGNFGWLDNPVANWFVNMVFIVIAFLALTTGKKDNYRMNIRDRITCLITYIFLVLFTIMSMVNHTITIVLFGIERSDPCYNIHEALYQIPYIGGLQGRYFIPYMILFFVGFPEIVEIPKSIKKSIMGIMIAVAVIYTTMLLKTRYIG